MSSSAGETAVLETASCWLCGADARVDEDYRSVSLYRCPDCGFLFAPERSVDELHELYGDEYFDDFHGEGSYADEYPQRRFEANKRLDWVTEHISSGRIMEIGAAGGVFLDEARKRGFDEVFGIEPAPSHAARARETFGIDVVAGFIEDAEIPPEPFDVIAAWHVLEHIPKPQPSMCRLRESIKDDGWLFLEIPNIESPRAIRFREGWYHLDPKNHVGFYTPDNLATLLEQSGFKLEEHFTVTPLSYQRPRLAIRPVSLALRALDTAQTHARQSKPHPWKHEFIRAIARPA